MLSDAELCEKYTRFAGFMSWRFTRKSDTFGTEDAEDWASQAVVSLLKCPAQHRETPSYVKRLIINSIIKSWRKGLRRKENELDATPATLGLLDSDLGPQTQQDIFDLLPGPNGLHHGVQDKIDYQTIIALLPKLPDAERLVIQLHFGLNGSRACGERVIAKKLGRTRDWAASRLRRGLDRVRTEIGETQQIRRTQA